MIVDWILLTFRIFKDAAVEKSKAILIPEPL